MNNTLEFIPCFGKTSALWEWRKGKEDGCLEALVSCVYLDEKDGMDKSELVKRCQSVSVKLLCNSSYFYHQSKCGCALRRLMWHNGLLIHVVICVDKKGSCEYTHI